MNTAQQYIPVWKRVELEKWTQRLYYRQIRGAESLLPGLTPAGKRIRGITLAPNFYLARDKHFYEVIDGVAKRMDATRVLQAYDLATLRRLYENAVHTVGA